MPQDTREGDGLSDPHPQGVGKGGLSDNPGSNNEIAQEKPEESGQSASAGPFCIDDRPLVEIMRPEIEATINRLSVARFAPDPIAGKHFSRIVSVMSSAYKRHGNILEKAILHQLSKCPRLEVWCDPHFQVSPSADLLANDALKRPLSIIGNQVNYGSGPRTLQVDIITYDNVSKAIRAYEVKRGFGNHDAGKKRSILRDTLCMNMLLKSYGAQRGLDVREAEAKAIFYYGKRSIPKEFSLVAEDLDTHFDWPIYSEIEEVNELFRTKLFQILSQ